MNWKWAHLVRSLIGRTSAEIYVLNISSTILCKYVVPVISSRLTRAVSESVNTTVNVRYKNSSGSSVVFIVNLENASWFLLIEEMLKPCCPLSINSSSQEARFLPTNGVLTPPFKIILILSIKPVNYSVNFVDSNTDVYTQNIENIGMRQNASKKNCGLHRSLSDSYLQEFIWRQMFGDELLENLVLKIATLYPVA